MFRSIALSCFLSIFLTVPTFAGPISTSVGSGRSGCLADLTSLGENLITSDELRKEGLFINSSFQDRGRHDFSLKRALLKSPPSITKSYLYAAAKVLASQPAEVTEAFVKDHPQSALAAVVQDFYFTSKEYRTINIQLFTTIPHDWLESLCCINADIRFSKALKAYAEGVVDERNRDSALIRLRGIPGAVGLQKWGRLGDETFLALKTVLGTASGKPLLIRGGIYQMAPEVVRWKIRYPLRIWPWRKGITLDRMDVRLMRFAEPRFFVHLDRPLTPEVSAGQDWDYSDRFLFRRVFQVMTQFMDLVGDSI